jgi:hypothetical protein
MGITYSVTWDADAVTQHSTILAAAEDPDRIRKASEIVDHMLRRIPGDMGESRGGKYRLWYSDVLGIFYHVDDVNFKVRVMRVALSKRPK